MPDQPRLHMRLSEFDPAMFAPRTKQGCWLDIADRLLGPLTTPLLVARGEPGPLLLVVAGVHGDEYEGMEAIRRVFARLDPIRLRGAFIGLPVANPFAYEARARAVPERIDGLNLARVFPGDPAGTPTRALASQLLSLVERCVGPDDLFVDLHSGSADVAFASLIGFRDVENPARARAEEAARHFGIPRFWKIDAGPGPFNAETARRNIPTVATETTGRAGCDPADVAEFASGLHNLLAWLEMTPDAPRPPRLESAPRATVDVLSPATGFYRNSAPLFARAQAGEPLGVIVDPFGDLIATVPAPVSGDIWASRSMPAVHAGELLHMIALDK